MKKSTPLDEMFDKYFHVRYSHFLSRTTDQLRRYGVRVTGDAEFDSTHEKEVVDTFMHIAGLFDLFKRGVTVSVVKYSDTAEIYRIVQSHLATWRAYLTSGIHAAPEDVLEDLVDMDRFASVIYDKAVSVFSDQERIRMLNVNLPLQHRFSLATVLKTPKSGDVKDVITTIDGKTTIHREKSEEKKRLEIKPRAGYNEIFAQHLRSISGWKRDDG